MFKDMMISIGFKNSLIVPGKEDMFRVVVASYDSVAACWDEVFRIRKEYPQYADTWALIVDEE